MLKKLSIFIKSYGVCLVSFKIVDRISRKGGTGFGKEMVEERGWERTERKRWGEKGGVKVGDGTGSLCMIMYDL